MKYLQIFFLMMLSLTGCRKQNQDTPTTDNSKAYFPPVMGDSWESTSPTSLGWNSAAIPALKNYLALKHTKSFMILVNGRIAMETYFDSHTPATTWPWNSAGKTLVSATTGIAQQSGLLNINTPVSRYLGTGWTSEPTAKEELITVRHLLTMTSGLNDENELVTKANMSYLADAGSRWSYSNVFQKLMDVVAAASNQDFESYFTMQLKNKIGMDGFWNFGIIFKIYHSTTRSMARFGLLALHNGKWEGEQILNDRFFSECISTSQNINPSYGYLWWLNGKNGYMVPGGQAKFQGALIPSGPTDMYMAAGAEDQRLYVIPGRQMVIVRMGDASDPQNPSFALSGFDNELWQKINAVIN